MNHSEVDVLLIDDEPSMLKVIGSCLTQRGYTFRTAENGRTAIQLLARYRFKLVVTDIHMPEVDGLEVIMHCRTTLPALTILAISGGGNFNTPGGVLKPARLLGCSHTLAKPFTGDEFLKAVHALVPSRAA